MNDEKLLYDHYVWEENLKYLENKDSEPTQSTGDGSLAEGLFGAAVLIIMFIIFLNRVM